LILKTLQAKGARFAIAISSVLFALVHLEAAPDITLIIVGIQSFLLLIYAVYLWKRIG
jgi:membrane protease YdiL (CAAX protease family)